MNLVHLTSSTFFGGPERQMLGLAEFLPNSIRTTFVSFPEGGRCRPFMKQARSQGFDAVALTHDFPRLRRTLRELAAVLRGSACHLLLCHGYKANILGRTAARRIGIPAVAVSRGWTGENRKMRAYEWIDRRHLRFMDRVVSVSDGQAAKVRRWCGVRHDRIRVIRNSARLDAFAAPDATARTRLLGFFPRDGHVSQVVLAAGRLSSEKGFGVLVEAAGALLQDNPTAGILLFGEGLLREQLEKRIAELGLSHRFLLPGFRSDLDSLIPAADLFVLPSFTEGLPNVVLEASAAGVPVVATAVGGTPEIVVDGETGFLVPAGEPDVLTERIGRLLGDAGLRRRLGEAGRARMQAMFTFQSQAEAYRELFEELLNFDEPATLAAGSLLQQPQGTQ